MSNELEYRVMKYKIKKAYSLFKAPEYQEWLDEQPLKSQRQIAGRLNKIEQEGHFGDHKFLENEIWELKWQNGRRIYYAFIVELNMVLLFGGNKNGQSKDIKNAQKIFNKYKKE